MGERCGCQKAVSDSCGLQPWRKADLSKCRENAGKTMPPVLQGSSKHKSKAMEIWDVPEPAREEAHST